MKISFIIPNYNGSNLLLKNLPKVIEEVKSYKDADIIVVDDASKDDSLSVLDKFDVKVLRNEKNLGFSSTVNKGVDASSSDIVVLLNSDVYPEKGFINNIIKNFDDPNVFGVGAMDKSIENGKTVLRGRGIGQWRRGFLIHRKGEVNKNNTLWVSGGSSAFRKSIWDKLGGLNTIYNPFYWEDIDLSYRALKSGYKLIFDSKSVVYHEHEKGSIKSNYKDNQVKTIAYRNQIIFSWMNITDFSLIIEHLIFLPYHILKALLRGDTPFLVGFLQALILSPKVIKSSLIAKRLFIRKDLDVIREFKE